MNSEWYVKKEDIKLSFKNGVAETEVLPGMWPSVHSFRGQMKAGATFTREKRPRVLTTYFITSGRGYILTSEMAYNIKEVSYFFTSLEEDFTMHAVTDLEYTKFDLTLSDIDMKYYNMNHLHLPLFRSESDLLRYDQNVEIGTTVQKSVVSGKQMVRIIVGSNYAAGGSGFYEIGHNAVAQWNVYHGENDIDFTVNGKTVRQQAGDVAYVKAGLPHGSKARDGKCLQYIYYELYVQEEGFWKVYPEGPFEDISKKK